MQISSTLTPEQCQATIRSASRWILFLAILGMLLQLAAIAVGGVAAFGVSPRHLGGFTWLTLVALVAILPVACSDGARMDVVRGVVKVAHIDDFEASRSQRRWSLVGEDRRDLVVLDLPPDHPPPMEGQRVEARGIRHGDHLRVRELVVLGNSSLTRPLVVAPPAGEHRLALVAINLTDASSDDIDVDYVQQLFFDEPTGVDTYFRHVSRGQHRFNLDVAGDGQLDLFGPYPIDGSRNSCNHYSWGDAALDLAEACSTATPCRPSRPTAPTASPRSRPIRPA